MSSCISSICILLLLENSLWICADNLIYHQLCQNLTLLVSIKILALAAPRDRVCTMYLFQLFLHLSTSLFLSTLSSDLYSSILNCVSVHMFQFEGPEGEWFQKLTARFCSHQSWALEQIKSRQKKEPRFNSFILVPYICVHTDTCKHTDEITDDCK